MTTNTPLLSSLEIVAAHQRLASIMDAGAEADPERLEELDAEALALFDTLADAVPEKLEALRAVALRLEADAKMLREEEKRLAARRHNLERGIESVRNYAAVILQSRRDAGQDAKIRTAGHTFWLIRSRSITGPIGNISAWREMGWIRERDPEPDKIKAKREAKEMDRLPQGFAWRERESISWR